MAVSYYLPQTTGTASEAGQAVREAFPFAVRKYPLAGPDGTPTPHFGLFRDDTFESVGTACRAGYVPHSVEDVALLAEAASVALGEQCTVAPRWREGHIVIVGPTREASQWGAVGTAADIVRPRLFIKAGYDGSAFSASLGVYRALCLNLHIIDPAHIVTARIRHTRSLRDRMGEVTEQFRMLASKWPDVLAAMRAMQARETSLADFVARVWPEADNATDRQRRAADRRFAKILARLTSEQSKLGEGLGGDRANVWLAYNAVQGYLQHDQRRKGSPDTIDRALIALDDSAVTRAHDIALALSA